MLFIVIFSSYSAFSQVEDSLQTSEIEYTESPRSYVEDSDYTTIFLILSILLNPIIVTGILIPRIQKLMELRDSLIRHKLAQPEYVGSHDISMKITSEKEEIFRIRDVLGQYTIRRKELRSILWILAISIFSMVIAIFLSYIFSGYSREIFFFHLIVQLFILSLAIRLAAISADKIYDLRYLIRGLGMNPFDLIDALEITPSIEHGKFILFSNFSSDDPLIAGISSKINIWGYRFLFAAYDNSKVYFASMGMLSPKATARTIILKPDRFFQGELNRIDLGKFCFHKIKGVKILNLVFLMFPDFYKNDERAPFSSQGTMEIYSAQSRGIPFSYTLSKIESDTLFDNIKYRYERYSMKITNIEDQDDLISKIVDKYRNKITTSRKIVVEKSKKGIPI